MVNLDRLIDEIDVRDYNQKRLYHTWTYQWPIWPDRNPDITKDVVSLLDETKYGYKRKI